MPPSLTRSLLLIIATVVAFAGPGAPAQAQTADPAAEARRLERECRDGRGDQDACTNYGQALFHGNGVEADQPRALRLWRSVCEREGPHDRAVACSNTVYALTRSTVIPQDFAQAVIFADRACTLGSGSGCARLGYMRRDGQGTAVDGASALQAFDMSCGYRYGEGCREAAFLVARGDLVPQDHVRSVSLLRQGCVLNDMRACAGLAYNAMNGQGMAVDAALAVREYKRACAGGVAVACSNIQWMHDNASIAVGYDELLAYEAVERAFPPTLPTEQRYLLARATFEGGDIPLAITGFKALADEGLADAAFNLGQIYYSGQGVPPDQAQGVRYINQAASAGHPYAKYLMAYFYRSGHFVDPNEIWSIQLMRSAAEEGGIAEAGPIWQTWQHEMNARYDARDAASRQMALDNEASQAAADAANMARIWGLYSSSQNEQENGQVCGTVYRNNQAHHECMARETFDNYYNPNR